MLKKLQTYSIQKKHIQSKVWYASLSKEVSLSKITGENKKNILLIYDEKLKNWPSFKTLQTQAAFTYSVKAGESLKSAPQFFIHLEALNKKYGHIINRNTHIVSVGGGSVGDFVGFLSSVWKRGLELTHIPSTWLAAVDSSHGGKTALNLNTGKNQIGSFHFASNIILIRELLTTSSFEAAYGEVIKMALLKKTLFSIISKNPKWSLDFFWQLLPKLVQAKYFFVKQDPFEEGEKRMYLNLGHTLAHVLEPHCLIPHGVAVIFGLEFSLNWSFKKKFISKVEFNRYKELLNPMIKKWKGKIKKIPKKQFIKLLLQDKKMQKDNTIKFVFLKSSGPSVSKIKMESLVTQLQIAGYIK